MNIKYIIITPVRDEERYIARTLQSVVDQSIRPEQWIIVDDGSVDHTAEIVEDYVQRYPWIRLIRRRDRGFRQSGAGVVEAFYEGYRALDCLDWDFIVKLDGDLSFGTQYFEQLIEKFHAQPKLGIAGGNLFHERNGNLQLEKCPRFHVRGANKMYRHACWEEIGGLITAPGWDTVDEVKANMMGWQTESFDEPRMVHHRFTGAAEGKWRDQLKNGRAYYVAGYHPLFMMAKCIYRLASRPYVLGSVAMAYGFLSGYRQRALQRRDPALVQYVHQQQLRRLMGKASIWR